MAKKKTWALTLLLFVLPLVSAVSPACADSAPATALPLSLIQPAEEKPLVMVFQLEPIKPELPEPLQPFGLEADGKQSYRRFELGRRALSYRGTPYRWGGTRSSGFDCSGFTKYVFGKMGVALKRSSREQYTQGTPVSLSQLKAGDLVFFNTNGSGISHVGIYLGGGKFVHASSGRGRVRVDSLREGYYQKRYVGARRIKLPDDE